MIYHLDQATYASYIQRTLILLDTHYPRSSMDASDILSRLGPCHEHDTRAARARRIRLLALASSREAQAQAEAFWGQEDIPASDPRRANKIRRCFGLCVEGGHTRPWNPVPVGGGQEASEQDRLGPGPGTQQARPVLGDRLWRDAQVRNLWTLGEDGRLYQV